MTDDLHALSTDELRARAFEKAERSRDVGFAGADWVVEKGVELVELLDTGLDPVRIVAAAAPDFLDGGRPGRPGFVPARPVREAALGA